MGLRGELLRHTGALHGVHTQAQRLLVEILLINTDGNTLFIHAVGDVYNILQRDHRGGLDIELDVVDGVQQCQIPGGELKFVHRHLVTILHILLHHVHSQRVDEDAVVDLDDQLILVKEPGRLLHQERDGEGHEVQRAAQQLIGILGKEIVNRIGRREIVGGGGFVSAKGLILTVVLDLIADDLALSVLDGLTHDIFAAHFRFPLPAPLLASR